MIPNEGLRETPVLIRDWSWCQDNETETQICAGGYNRGTTQGDSGGPLLLIRNHKWVQFGVTSVGTYRAVPGDLLALKDLGMFGTFTWISHSSIFPGIYTRVSAYCDWIAETTDQEVTCQWIPFPTSNPIFLTVLRVPLWKKKHNKVQLFVWFNPRLSIA